MKYGKQPISKLSYLLFNILSAGISVGTLLLSWALFYVLESSVIKKSLVSSALWGLVWFILLGNFGSLLLDLECCLRLSTDEEYSYLTGTSQ